MFLYTKGVCLSLSPAWYLVVKELNYGNGHFPTTCIHANMNENLFIYLFTNENVSIFHRSPPRVIGIMLMHTIPVIQFSLSFCNDSHQTHTIIVSIAFIKTIFFFRTPGISDSCFFHKVKWKARIPLFKITFDEI